MGYVAYVLDEQSVNVLKEKFAPKYPDFIGHHITFRMGTSIVPEQPKEIKVVGYVDDQVGLEAFIVQIDGVQERLDEGTYHITWSLDRVAGRKPVDSNTVIKQLQYTEIDHIQINGKPEIL